VFLSKEDGQNLQRTCAPMDHAAGARIKDGIPRYWFWDYDSDEKTHTLGLQHERIVSIVKLEQLFEPAEFVTWTPKWVVPRDWGHLS
jgi:hypothetical protein